MIIPFGWHAVTVRVPVISDREACPASGTTVVCCGTAVFAPQPIVHAAGCGVFPAVMGVAPVTTGGLTLAGLANVEIAVDDPFGVELYPLVADVTLF